MTPELTKAAQQALEALKNVTDYDQINAARRALQAALTQRPAALRPGASNEATTQTQDDSSSDVQVDQGRVRHADSRVGSTVPDLTQRPAEQPEREAWVPYRVDRADGVKGLSLEEADSLLRQITIPTIRASLPAPQQATPDQFADASKMVPPVALRSVHLTRDTAGMCVVRVNGRVAIRDNGDIIDHTATLEWFADTQQATPEPVGEPLFWYRPRSDGGYEGPLHDSSIEDVRKRSGAWMPLFTRPAPGVPEGFALVPMTEDELNEMALQLGREMKGLRCWGWMDLVRAVERHHSKKLAAAQAKGYQP